MRIITIEKEEKGRGYFIFYKKNDEIFTFGGSLREWINEIRKNSCDKIKI